DPSLSLGMPHTIRASRTFSLREKDLDETTSYRPACAKAGERDARSTRAALRRSTLRRLLPNVHAALLGSLSKGTVVATQNEFPSLRQFQICGVVDRQLMSGGQLRQPRKGQ